MLDKDKRFVVLNVRNITPHICLKASFTQSILLTIFVRFDFGKNKSIAKQAETLGESLQETSDERALSAYSSSAFHMKYRFETRSAKFPTGLGRKSGRFQQSVILTCLTDVECCYSREDGEEVFSVSSILGSGGSPRCF